MLSPKFLIASTFPELPSKTNRTFQQESLGGESGNPKSHFLHEQDGIYFSHTQHINLFYLMTFQSS